MFVNFLKQIYVIIQRRIQGGGYGGSSPSWISELYAFLGGGGGAASPPPKRKRKERPYLEENLNIFKTLSSSQRLLSYIFKTMSSS